MNGKAELLQFFRKNKISVLPNLSGYGNIFCVRSSAGCKSSKALTDEARKKIRLRGQAVKTSPFHGGNSGSIPDGVTISIIGLYCSKMWQFLNNTALFL